LVIENPQGHKPRISIIVAMAKNRVIGANNKLPWHISDDLKRFKQLTMGHTLIMGRKTFDSIGRPLPGRVNIVVSRNPSLSIPGAIVVPSLEEAIAKTKGEKAYVIGGSEIFAQALPLAAHIDLTQIDAEVEGDVFFPEISESTWQETSRDSLRDPKNGLSYHNLTLERRYPPF
jgi:dihydrofolate reductase